MLKGSKSKDEKSVAGSALSQAKKKKSGRKPKKV
jgi:hypothetical protein